MPYEKNRRREKRVENKRYKSKEAIFLSECLDIFVRGEKNPLVSTLISSFGNLFKLIDADPKLRAQASELLDHVRRNWNEPGTP